MGRVENLPSQKLAQVELQTLSRISGGDYELSRMKIKMRLNPKCSSKWFKSLILTLFVAVTLGCGQEGTVLVDVGEPPVASAFQVDLYAREAGLDVLDGVRTQATEVTLENVPEGEWALFIQALDDEGTTLSHFQAEVTVQADEITEVVAGAYSPGLPSGSLPEALEVSESIDSFGPNDEALLSAIFAPDSDTLPAATVALELTSGETDGTELDIASISARQEAQSAASLQCGTCFISEADIAEANVLARTQGLRTREFRPQIAAVEPGETFEFFVITTFEFAFTERLLDDSQTENCLIFAEIQGDGTTVITEEEALAIAEAFDSDNPFQEGDSGIYNETRNRFGSEWRIGGGRDGDERVVLLFLSSSTIGGDGLFGFFNPADELPSLDIFASNESELLYINADRISNGDIYDALGTISHELSHLILYNQKVALDGTFPEGANSEIPLLDEGLAVLNEDLNGFGFTGELGGNGFLLDSVSGLLEDGLNRRFFLFDARFSDYGAGYLLWRFILDREGPETLTALVTSTETGRQNFRTIIPQPFEELFLEFGQAVATNTRQDVPESVQFTDLDFFQTYQVRGRSPIELNGLQEIEELSGPGDFSADREIEPWGTVFFTANGGDGGPLDWQALGAESLFTGLLNFEDAESL